MDKTMGAFGHDTSGSAAADLARERGRADSFESAIREFLLEGQGADVLVARARFQKVLDEFNTAAFDNLFMEDSAA